MDFSLLGPVAVTAGTGEITLGPVKRRSLLAMLLLQPNATVPVEQLITCLWDEEPPEHARTVIQGHVSRLRATLAEAGADAYGVELITHGSAYRLRMPEQLVDSERFSELVSLARPETAPEQAVDLLRQGLDLWRGPALTGTVPSPPFAAAAHALEERRLAAVEALARAHGALGQYEMAADVLHPAAVANQLREGLIAALMLALYRIGRQSDAIAWYHRTRQLLADDLGVDPGERLRTAYEEILRAAPTAGRPRAAAEPTAQTPRPAQAQPQAQVSAQGRPQASAEGQAQAPAQEQAQVPAQAAHPPTASGPQLLPRPPAGFLGRDRELTSLTRLTLPADGPGGPAYGGAPTGLPPEGGITVVTGPAGVGKTGLVVYWGHAHADAFPDGRLFADLRGFSGGEAAAPAEVLRDFLHALGTPADRIPPSPEAAGALYRSLVAERRLLVVLDNAGSSAQVRPLLPGGPRSATLVTSRSRLDGLIATDAAHPVRLHALGPEDGVALLGTLLGPDRVAEDPEAAHELVALCDGLPLALRAASAQLLSRPRWRLARLATALRDERRRLALLSAEDAGVAAALRNSVARLSADDARLLRTLGTGFAREVNTAEAAALAGADPELIQDGLERLAEMHLLDEEATNRYVMSDLVKLFAQDSEDRKDGDRER
ncbi:putative AfsR-like transcriptional regulator [Streptomyces bingchenggensis BCW-1]|uniref:Putative AfsR-like transcriptional regulator n=1 Tax=Streptomyces bingchenggensis (strain BCW-1) TaxID=749414 RepID=D7CAL7_STRBB|nr:MULTISPECIES: BTAD domain-containing putative transcriptional regulator [Streptomyces]ADI08584.1 putative AfsR-like transcriptional regulator [Streptomyces bingchenggensis BCW-1]